jgi:hypothetical protein
MKRVIIGAIVGGLVMFMASFVTHTVLPIGEMGVKNLPNEDTVVAAMKQSISEPGFYFFPGMDMSGGMSKEEEQAWQAKYEAGPIGILIYHPVGQPAFSLSQMINELLADIIASFLALLIIGQISSSYFKRVAMLALFGVIAWLAISVSYWNWYGFPGSYAIGEGLDQVISWGLGGLVMAGIVKSKSA